MTYLLSRPLVAIGERLEVPNLPTPFMRIDWVLLEVIHWALSLPASAVGLTLMFLHCLYLFPDV